MTYTSVRQRVVVLSHYDADGVTSAKILEYGLGVPVDVRFQKWWAFGVQKFDVEWMTKYSTVFVTDLGTTKETLENLKKVSEKGTDVYLLDHHPPYEKYEEYQSPKLNIINDVKNCGAGITYRYVREITGKDSDPFLKALVTVGLYADVADETEGGEAILSGLAEEGVSEFQWKTVRWDGKVEQRYTLASAIGLAINVCRRVAYDEGAYLASKMLDENNTYDTLFDLAMTLMDIPTYAIAQKPYTALVKGWVQAWNEHRNDALSLNVCRTFEVEGLTVAVTNHPWDVAPYVANVKSRNMPCIAINYGVPSNDYASLSGRAPEGTLDMNALMTAVTEITSGLISGGGHPVAVGGLVRRELSLRDILRAFEMAVKVVRS